MIVNWKLKIALIAWVLCSATGCAGDSLKLGPEWAPLEQIRESKVIAAGLGKAGARTIGDTIYVKNIEDFQAANAGVLFDGVLLHERVHAIRQLELGVYEWLGRYATDTDFMWDEEKRGWAVYLGHLRTFNVAISAEQTAKVLSDYKNIRGSMVSYNEALEWVKQVLSGTWKAE